MTARVLDSWALLAWLQGEEPFPDLLRGRIRGGNSSAAEGSFGDRRPGTLRARQAGADLTGLGGGEATSLNTQMPARLPHH